MGPGLCLRDTLAASEIIQVKGCRTVAMGSHKDLTTLAAGFNPSKWNFKRAAVKNKMRNYM